MEFVLKVVGVLGGTAAVILALVGAAYWLFQLLADRWLQSKFDARLESLKHAQNQELEQLKFRINSVMDRATKLHEREYQILPELWHALATAWGEVSAYTSPLQSLPDFSHMTDEQLDEHLARTELFETQKQAVRDSSDKTRAFQEEIYWHKKAEVEGHARSFSRSLRFNGVLVPSDIKAPMNRLADLMWEALIEKQYNEEDKPMPRQRAARTKLQDEGKPLLDQVEQLIHERLWSTTKLD